MKIFDHFMQNPYWKRIYEKAPSDECKEYYRIMFEYFSFETDEEDEEGIQRADDRLTELMLTRQDAEYIRERAGSPMAKYHYRKIIMWWFDEEKAETAPASMFKGEIRNPDYLGNSQRT